MITPYSVSGQNRYCRLFAPSQNRPDFGTEAFKHYIKGLLALAAAMKDDGSTICKYKAQYTINAGYTYFGQFVDHNLTNDPSSIDDAWRYEPEEIKNGHHPRLDLGHIYGRGPWHNEDQKLYDGVRLKVGLPIEMANGTFRSFDIAVSDDKTLLVGDIRNYENVIIRQITALFCRLHNLAVEQFRPTYGKDPVALFRRAKLQTTWQFQRLVCEDYLGTVLDPVVYASVFLQRHPKVRWNVFSIPAEFSAAAMRFGHSMVRNSYSISSSNDQPLITLLRRGTDPQPLDATWEIDWGQFFQGASQTGGPVAVTAQPVDTGIASALHNLPIVSVLLFNTANLSGFDLDGLGPIIIPPLTLPLGFLDLTRGAGLRLPSGQAVAAGFGEPVLSERQLTCNCEDYVTDQGEVLKENGLARETPLWYYILKESEVLQNGSCLGPTGSHIIAETVFGALLHDPDAFINHPDAPAPASWPTWEFPSGKCEIQSLSDLFGLATEIP